MRRLNASGRLVSAAGLAASALIASPGSAAAECSYVPPLPKVSMAIPSAKELFVGEVIANGLWNNGPARTRFTVRIDEVLRGPAKVGDIRRFDWVSPNWPWTKGTGSAPAFPACTYLVGKVGEKVILALDARTAGQTLHAYRATWYQPPTTFSTIGIVNGSSREQYGSNGRQLFSLERLRELASVAPPDTATEPDLISPPVTRPIELRPGLLALVVLVAGVAGLWRRRRWS